MDELNNMTDEEFEAKMNSGEFDEQLTETSSEEQEQVETTETAEDTTEQPITDSSDISDDENTDDETKEDPKEDDKVDADPDESTEDGKSTEEETEVKDSKDDLLAEYLNSTSTIKAIGKEFAFTNKEKLESFDKVYKQAMDYTRKTQAVAKHRKRISAMEELGMTDEQFNTMIDVAKGNKDAITSVIKQAGIDALDIDTEQELNYTPNHHGKSDKELEIDDAFGAIKGTPTGDRTTNVLGAEWDDRSRDQIVEGLTLPNGAKMGTQEVIENLHYDMENGIYDEVAPEMLKLKQLDGAKKSDLDYYVEAGIQRLERMAQAKVAAEQAEKLEAVRLQAEADAKAKVIADAKAAQVATEQAKIAAEKKKAAAVTQGAGGTTNGVDYLDMDNMSDEEFMKFMDKQIG